MRITRVLLVFVAMTVLIYGCQSTSEGFSPLFNGKNFEGLYLKLRSGDDEMAKKVFSIEDESIHVFNQEFPPEYKLDTGENDTHGLFYTKKSYSKYILKFDYKWGKNIANNFGKWQYDAGVYYHVTNDRVWPLGIEYQIRYDHRYDKNHTGDLIRPNGVEYNWFANEQENEFLSPLKGGKRINPAGWLHLASDTRNFNALNDEWNHCEIIVMGSEYAIHKLNGEVVNLAIDLNPGAGIIGFQSETAEIFYRNIEIMELSESLPMAHFLQ